MLATAMQPAQRTVRDTNEIKAPFPRPVTRTTSSPASPQSDELQRRYQLTLQALVQTRARAERAERRLRSRLTELTWPAALSGMVAGFVAIVGLRLAGM